MLVVNEQELLNFWIYSQMQIEALEEFSPDWFEHTVRTFHKLTLFGRSNLIEQMLRSDWYL